MVSTRWKNETPSCQEFGLSPNELSTIRDKVAQYNADKRYFGYNDYSDELKRRVSVNAERSAKYRGVASVFGKIAYTANKVVSREPV